MANMSDSRAFTAYQDLCRRMRAWAAELADTDPQDAIYLDACAVAWAAYLAEEGCDERPCLAA